MGKLTQNERINRSVTKYRHHHRHPSTAEVDRTFMEISSQTPQFAIAVLRFLVSSPKSQAITLTRAYMLAYVTALYPLGTGEWEMKIFLYLCDRNDQQTGDVLAWVSKRDLLVPHPLKCGMVSPADVLGSSRKVCIATVKPYTESPLTLYSP